MPRSGLSRSAQPDTPPMDDSPSPAADASGTGPRAEAGFGGVLRDSLSGFALKALGAGLGFAFNVVLGRMLGADGAGIYFLAATVSGIAAVVGRVGLDNAVLRFAAAAAAQGRWSDLAGLRARSLRITAGASLAAAAVVVLAAPWIAGLVFSEPGLTTPLRLMALGIPATALLTIHGELLKALRRIRAAMLVQAVAVPAVMLPVLAVLATPMGVSGAALAHAAGAMVVLVLAAYLWRWAAPQIQGITGEFDRSALLESSMPLFWVALMNLALAMTDTIMLGIWTASDQVGIYGAAMRTTAVSTTLLAIVNSVVGPRMSALWVHRDGAALRRLVRSSTLLMAALALPLLALFVLFPEWVLGLFGPGFDRGATAMVVLAVGQFLALSTGPVAFLLMMTGRERIHRNNVVFTAIVNVVLNAWWIPLYGIVGAAFATALSLALKNVIAVVCARYVLRTAPAAAEGRDGA